MNSPCLPGAPSRAPSARATNESGGEPLASIPFRSAARCRRDGGRTEPDRVPKAAVAHQAAKPGRDAGLRRRPDDSCHAHHAQQSPRARWPTASRAVLPAGTGHRHRSVVKAEQETESPGCVLLATIPFAPAASATMDPRSGQRPPLVTSATTATAPIGLRARGQVAVTAAALTVLMQTPAFVSAVRSEGYGHPDRPPAAPLIFSRKAIIFDGQACGSYKSNL